jgi:hypothetical protein
MKKFELNNKSDQRDEMVLYAFSSDVLTASEKELVSFLKVFNKYIPTRDTPWSDQSKAVNSGTPIHNNWLIAHDRISSLIKEKQESQWHWRMFCLSLLSIFVLTSSIGYRILVSEVKVADLEARLNTLEKKSLNKYSQQDAEKDAAPLL